MVLLIIFVVAGSASAWRGHHRGHSRSGVFIGPPVIYFAPPPVYQRYYYPRDYYDPGDRVWIPGYWDYRESLYGWDRVWIPGHWEWRYGP